MRQFYVSAGKPHAHKIPRFFFGGGCILGFLGGGECRFYFYGRGDFSDFLVTEIAVMGERQSIAHKDVRAIDTRNSQLGNGSNAAKTSVRAPGLSTDEREHAFV